MSNPDSSQIQTLVDKGKNAGFLVLKEINRIMSGETSLSSEECSKFIDIFERFEKAVTDLMEKKDRPAVAHAESADEREKEIVKTIEMHERDALYALVEIPVTVKELIRIRNDLQQNRIGLEDVVRTVEENKMNQRRNVILLIDEIRFMFMKKRSVYRKLDACNTLAKRVAQIQHEIVRYKEYIVTRLCDIGISETLTDRLLGKVEDCADEMRKCQDDISARIPKGIDSYSVKSVFREFGAGRITPAEAADRLRIAEGEFKVIEDCMKRLIELEDECCHNPEDLLEVIWRVKNSREAARRAKLDLALLLADRKA